MPDDSNFFIRLNAFFLLNYTVNANNNYQTSVETDLDILTKEVCGVTSTWNSI